MCARFVCVCVCVCVRVRVRVRVRVCTDLDVGLASLLEDVLGLVGQLRSERVAAVDLHRLSQGKHNVCCI